jgi:hypothetical protein
MADTTDAAAAAADAAVRSTSTDSSVVVEVTGDATGAAVSTPTAVDRTPAPGLGAAVSLYAVQLSERAATGLLSAIATAGILASTAVPSTVVAASALVAQAQTQAVVTVADVALVYLPADAATVQLLRRLIETYAVANPAALRALGGMSVGGAAATSALGGALPLIVAAARQEAVEVSRLVSGVSTPAQFAVASQRLVARVAGGVAGLAAGALAGTMVMPGIGTGIGSVVGSYAGATVAPWFVPDAQAAAAVAASPVGGYVPGSPAAAANEDDERERRTSRTFLSAAGLLDDGDGSAAAFAPQQQRPQSLASSTRSSSSVFHFAWMDEMTPEGFVVLPHEHAAVDGAPANDAATLPPPPATPADAQRALFDAARALLSRSVVVPMLDVQRQMREAATAHAATDADAACAGAAAPVDPESTRALLRQLPGSVLVVRSRPSSVAAFSAPATSAAGGEAFAVA